ncbi:MAG: hypothetical protein ACE5G6_01910 [Terriglobia bacterium]
MKRFLLTSRLGGLLLLLLGLPAHAQTQEILTANLVVYLVEPTAPPELAEGVLLPQTFSDLRDEASFLRLRFQLRSIDVMLLQTTRFPCRCVSTAQYNYRGQPIRAVLAWHRREGDQLWMELGLTYGQRPLLRVPSFVVPNRGTFAISGEVELLGTERFLNQEEKLERRAAQKQVVITLTPIWETRSAAEAASGTLSVDPSTIHADLHITRETYYAEGAVDLSQIPLYTNTRTGETVVLGTVPHVQSLLVEAFDGQPTIKIFRGRIRFSPNVKVLGIVTRVASADSPRPSPLQTTERLFSREKPVAGGRVLRQGLEASAPGSTAWDDFVRVEGNTVYFQLGITMGADDFRILLQYELDAFTTASFEVELEDTVIQKVRTSGGLVVGGDHLGDNYLFSGLRLSGAP